MLSSIFGFFSGVGSDAKASAYNAGDPGLIPGSGRFPGEGNGNPLQYSCVGVLLWTGTWWSGVDDKKVKERAGGGKGRERARKKERHGNPSSDGAKVLY